jgi:hypothetical protein
LSFREGKECTPYNLHGNCLRKELREWGWREKKNLNLNLGELSFEGRGSQGDMRTAEKRRKNVTTFMEGVDLIQELKDD